MSETLVHWEPLDGLREVPVETFNFDWQSDQTLRVSVIFAPIVDGENFPAARLPATLSFSSVGRLVRPFLRVPGWQERCLKPISRELGKRGREAKISVPQALGSAYRVEG
jgi:hypothetical protein